MKKNLIIVVDQVHLKIVIHINSELAVIRTTCNAELHYTCIIREQNYGTMSNLRKDEQLAIATIAIKKKTDK